MDDRQVREKIKSAYCKNVTKLLCLRDYLDKSLSGQEFLEKVEEALFDTVTELDDLFFDMSEELIQECYKEWRQEAYEHFTKYIKSPYAVTNSDGKTIEVDPVKDGIDWEAEIKDYFSPDED